MPDILSKIPEFSWPVVFAIVHPNVGGILGGFITRKNINPWYQVNHKYHHHLKSNFLY